LKRLLLVLGAVSALHGAELSPKTLQEFENYMKTAEREMEARAASAEKRLWSLDQPDRLARLRSGQMVIGGTNGEAVRDVTDGLVHDWTGAILIKGVKAETALAVLQDYARHKEIYGPEVASSRLVERKGDEFHTHLRLVKKKIISVVLDAEFKVRWRQAGPKAWQSTTRSIRISEVDNPGEPDERVGPPDKGYGFLWRINSYWTVDEREEGAFIECRAISLTRDIPALLDRIIRPMVTSLPRESLAKTLESTRRAVASRTR
jgi:hypothetical protein